MSEPEATWVVDRLEGDAVVLVEDGTEATRTVSRDRFATLPREGEVLRVPLLRGEPDWARARADEALRRARLDRARDVLDGLRKRDPGGDVVL